MLTTSEQQELCQIEAGLRDIDRGFAWRLTLLQGMLRWAAPGRRTWLPVLAVLAAAPLRLGAFAGLMLMALARGAALLEPSAAVMALGNTAWPGWKPAPGPGPATRQVRDRPRSRGTDLP